MFSWWTNLSVRYKLGLTTGLLVLLLAVTLVLSVRAIQSEAGDAREINEAGFLRATLVRMTLLATNITNAERGTEQSIDAFENALEANLGPHTALVGLFNASEAVSRDEYSLFLINLEQNYPNITWVSYVQQIAPNQREEVEQSVRDEGFSFFTFYEFDETNTPQTSPTRAVYFPIIYIEPFELHRQLVGLDLGADQSHLEAMFRARNLGEPIAVPFVRPNIETSLLVFNPIYENGVIPATITARQENLLGFVVSNINMSGLVSTVNRGQTSQILSVSDITDADSEIPLHDFPNSFDLSVTQRTFTIWGRTWTIQLTQELDVNVAEAQLASFDNFYQQQLVVLEEGDTELGIPGLVSHSNPELIDTFNLIKASYADYQFNLSRFTRAQTLEDRFSSLGFLEQNQERTFGVVDSYVDLLDQRAEQRAEQSLQQAIIFAVIAGILTLLVVLSVLWLTGNLLEVNRVAEQIAHGDLSSRSQISSQDEVGQISANINSLANRLETLVTNLEAQVIEQTRDLETVLDVSGRISTILQVDRLLQDVTDLIKERFNLYHAHIYLLDYSINALVLTAGSGYVGRQMVSEHRTIPISNLRSIVAEVARSQQSRIVNNVQASPTFLPHPLLPDTHSELATALVSRGQVLGVLDVQSDQLNYFDTDIQKLLETTASQVATAISNARLFEETDRSRRHQEALGRITEQMQTATDIDEFLQIVARELGKALRVPNTAIELGLSTPRPAIMTSED